MKLLWALLFLFGFLNQYVTSDVTKDSSPSPSNTNSTASVQAVTTKPLSNVTSWQKTSPTTAAIKNISINVSRATTTATTVSDSTATQTDKGKSITDSHPALETVQTTDGSPATTLIFTSVPKVFTTLQQETASRASPSIISTISQVDRTGSTRQPLTSTLLTTSSVLSWTSVSTTKNHPDITANDNLPHIQPTTAEKEEELECVNLEINSGAGHKIINCTTEKKRKIILKVTHDVWEKCRIGFQVWPALKYNTCMQPACITSGYTFILYLHLSTMVV
ncbi:mucin-2-like [Scleropages formosus]|uniref:mucin-2-like n=1 Tax=Scleropages formosus TaxID=113540 RepID=UPI0010FAADB7|nr:mucin-2-like [Scleropages formosus]